MPTRWISSFSLVFRRSTYEPGDFIRLFLEWPWCHRYRARHELLDTSHGHCLRLARRWSCRCPRGGVCHPDVGVGALVMPAQDRSVSRVDYLVGDRIHCDFSLSLGGAFIGVAVDRGLAWRQEIVTAEVHMVFAPLPGACSLALVSEQSDEKQRIRGRTERRFAPLLTFFMRRHEEPHRYADGQTA